MRTAGRSVFALLLGVHLVTVLGCRHGAGPAAGGQSAGPGGGPDRGSMRGMAGNGSVPGGAPMQGTQGMPAGEDMPGMKDAGSAADGAMAHEHLGMGPHMRMTAPRMRTAADDRRADAIVETLRGAMARYRDYRAAVADGYVQFLPRVRQPIYHFTNWRYGVRAQFMFDVAHPTSLLYRPVPGGGFELVGAMYTAPRRYTEDQLDRRVPLSVTAWHQHVNICMPGLAAWIGRKSTVPPSAVDWHRFGITGSIATAAECQESGGTFHPVILGWMVHVYPFEHDPARIWAH